MASSKQTKIGALASAIAKIEGHKSQARIGDIRELLGILSDMAYSDRDVVDTLIASGIARAKRKKKSVSAPA